MFGKSERASCFSALLLFGFSKYRHSPQLGKHNTDIGELRSEGGLTEYDYDPLHRLTQTRQSGAGVAEKRVDFTYLDDGWFGALARYSDLAGLNKVAESTYAYDGIGRLTDLVQTSVSVPTVASCRAL